MQSEGCSADGWCDAPGNDGLVRVTVWDDDYGWEGPDDPTERRVYWIPNTMSALDIAREAIRLDEEISKIQVIVDRT